MTLDLPARLDLDGGALVANWRALARMAGVPAGAAVKADGYGLGARGVADRLVAAGCRDLFVATWAEALALGECGAAVAVLHGVREEDMAATGLPNARPVLTTPEQVRRWRDAGGGACDVMVDTGMHRLGVSAEDVAAGLLDGLRIDVLMSHLACADENSAMNAVQRNALAGLRDRTSARRLSLANSAGIALGKDYAFDLVRPGLALYGGVPCAALADIIRPVARPEAQILQRRRVPAGGAVGYNATWTAPADTEVAIVNLGYADGYWRGFSGKGFVRAGEAALPVIGRVSMDLTALDVSTAPALAEGDWVTFDYALPKAAAASGMSQYELLTGLGSRFARVWR
ncbi:alanine racemase [Sphingomonas donggukensis]|uniref:Alanine racemase n=1 Tax=Sphingomonas donggukensis TaxID=2949093 RepID=A0ABY4TW44_9SPHN|nr:alanine racemase [Sphingomonas donggukensis]URW75931.1 alanine racemase [Sphingomonas donggukensis]